ncbi:PadR family transcriptional regulator [Cellulomonas triticagri]|uniref:PadR family transcriptional regulator n=1 Tax=Cellulomonas triticagri TaxID=2483352 RepID=A0A3M2J6K0_9CELL|nr:PadR family transcriptional regulator [Cellulomonas triticagri]RMI09049.1 PadR family transcriptional regulator [Cellulomonas triticagri]
MRYDDTDESGDRAPRSGRDPEGSHEAHDAHEQAGPHGQEHGYERGYDGSEEGGPHERGHGRGPHGRGGRFGGRGPGGGHGPGGHGAGGFGPGGFGPGGFGPGGFGPGGFGPGFGPGGRRGRRPRGDVRNAVLLLLAEQPMHGYQLMEAIAERSGGRWRPSPGAIYPTLNLLEDEGVLTLTRDAGRKLATLTAEGRALVERESAGWPDPFGSDEQHAGVDLRGEAGQLLEAVRAVGRGGTEPQRERAAQILADARRSVYRILAGDDEPTA